MGSFVCAARHVAEEMDTRKNPMLIGAQDWASRSIDALDQAAGNILALRRSTLARPPICRFRVFRRQIWPSVWPFDHGVSIAAAIAARSAATPFATL